MEKCVVEKKREGNRVARQEHDMENKKVSKKKQVKPLKRSRPYYITISAMTPTLIRTQTRNKSHADMKGAPNRH